MPTREAFIKRRIEYLEGGIKNELEEIGDLTRELMQMDGKETNHHGDYGGDIHGVLHYPDGIIGENPIDAARKTLNCAPIAPPWPDDPFVDGKEEMA